MIYKNGDKYSGNWVRNRRHGLGAFYRRHDGEHKLVYKGEWHRDQPSVTNGRIQRTAIRDLPSVV